MKEYDASIFPSDESINKNGNMLNRHESSSDVLCIFTALENDKEEKLI